MRILIEEETALPGTGIVLEAGDSIEFDNKLLESSDLKEMSMAYYDKYIDVALESLIDSFIPVPDKVSSLMNNIDTALSSFLEKSKRVKFKMLMLKLLKISLQAEKDGVEIGTAGEDY